MTTTLAPLPPGEEATVVAGNFQLDVSNPQSFVADPAAKAGVAQSIAKLNNLPVTRVQVTLELRESGRRLSALRRRLQRLSVLVNYALIFNKGVDPKVTDSVVETMAKTEPAQMTRLVTESVPNDYTVTVTNMVVPLVETGPVRPDGSWVTTQWFTTTLTETTSILLAPLPTEETNVAMALGVSFGALAAALVFLMVGLRLRGSSQSKVEAVKKEEVPRSQPALEDAKPEERGGGRGVHFGDGALPAPGEGQLVPLASPVRALEEGGFLRKEAWGESPTASKANDSRLRLEGAKVTPEVPPVPPWLQDEEPPSEADAPFWSWAREAVEGLKTSGKQPNAAAARQEGGKGELVKRWQASTASLPTNSHYYTLPGALLATEQRAPAPGTSSQRLPPLR